MFQVVSVQLIKEDPELSIKGICVERGRLAAGFDVVVGGLNHMKDIPHRRYVEALLIMLRDAKSLRR